MSKSNYNGVEVIGAGWGRTGTNSLMKALEILGYDPCYHMEKVIADNTGNIWARVYQGKLKNFKEIFEPKQYRATCDFPSSYFWKEQLQQYPNAKVILTTRDPVKWHQSCMNTIFRALPGNSTTPFGLKICNFLGLGPIHALSKEMVSRVFHHQQTDQEKCIQLFNEYNEKVIRECPKDKLLVFQVEQGWKPLCEFLNKPIPDVPFPRLNDTVDFQRHLESINQIGYRILGAIIVIVAGSIWGCSRFINLPKSFNFNFEL